MILCVNRVNLYNLYKFCKVYSNWRRLKIKLCILRILPPRQKMHPIARICTHYAKNEGGTHCVGLSTANVSHEKWLAKNCSNTVVIRRRLVVPTFKDLQNIESCPLPAFGCIRTFPHKTIDSLRNRCGRLAMRFSTRSVSRRLSKNCLRVGL